jgi:hypothetical protein
MLPNRFFGIRDQVAQESLQAAFSQIVRHNPNTHSHPPLVLGDKTTSRHRFRQVGKELRGGIPNALISASGIAIRIKHNADSCNASLLEMGC